MSDVKRTITILSSYRLVLERIKVVYLYRQWRQPKSLSYLQKIPSSDNSYHACLHEEYLPTAIPCLSKQILMLISILTRVNILVCFQKEYCHACKTRSGLCRLYLSYLFFNLLKHSLCTLISEKTLNVFYLLKQTRIYILSIFGFKNLFCIFFPTV